jgi:hypothetical protein
VHLCLSTFLISYFLTFLLSYFLTFLLSTCAHTSSLSLIGGTCAPLSVYFLTFLLSYFLSFLPSTRAHTSSLSLIGGTCAPLSVYFLTFLPSTSCVLTSSLSLIGGTCAQISNSFDPRSILLRRAPPNALLVALRDGRRPLHPLLGACPVRLHRFILLDPFSRTGACLPTQPLPQPRNDSIHFFAATCAVISRD